MLCCTCCACRAGACARALCDKVLCARECCAHMSAVRAWVLCAPWCCACVSACAREGAVHTRVLCTRECCACVSAVLMLPPVRRPPPAVATTQKPRSTQRTHSQNGSNPSKSTLLCDPPSMKLSVSELRETARKTTRGHASKHNATSIMRCAQLEARQADAPHQGCRCRCCSCIRHVLAGATHRGLRLKIEQAG